MQRRDTAARFLCRDPAPRAPLNKASEGGWSIHVAFPLSVAPPATLSNVSLSDYSDWDPKTYLAEYYAQVMPDERFALEFLVEAARRLPPEANVLLEFGCGPTVHHLFPLVNRVAEIHLAEYHPGNRAEIENWLRREPGAPDWRDFAKETLALENNDGPAPSNADVEAREEMVRARVTRVLPGDAFDTDPLGANRRGFYPLVATHYCAEAITRDIETWRACMRNIAGLVAPGGVLLLSACGAADYYVVGDQYFPCAGVRPADVLNSLVENGFGAIDLRVRQVPDHSEQGYSSVIFASGVKTAPAAPAAGGELIS